jgi:hypothetical protein
MADDRKSGRAGSAAPVGVDGSQSSPGATERAADAGVAQRAREDAPQGHGRSPEVHDHTGVASGSVDPLLAFLARESHPHERYGRDTDDAERKWPLLWSLMTRRVLPDGRLKELATVKVQMVPNGVRAVLTDTSMAKEWAVVVERLSTVWEALEAALNDPAQSCQKEIRYGEGWKKIQAEERKALDRKKAKG